MAADDGCFRPGDKNPSEFSGGDAGAAGARLMILGGGEPSSRTALHLVELRRLIQGADRSGQGRNGVPRTGARDASTCPSTTATSTFRCRIERNQPGDIRDEQVASNSITSAGVRRVPPCISICRLQASTGWRIRPGSTHSWNATFYVTPRGLDSSPIPDGPGIEILFDLLDHEVVGTCGNGSKASFPLEPMTVAGVPRPLRATDLGSRRHADFQRAPERGAPPGSLRRG